MAKLGRILAVMGAGLGGYMDGQREKKREGERDADRAYIEEQRARTRKDWQRSDKIDADVATASAPVAPVESLQADLSDPEAAPMQQFNVQGRMYAGQGEANTAATAANDPQAVAQRQAMAYMQNGDPAKAQQIRTGARQERLAEMQVSSAEAANKRDTSLREMGGLIINGGWAAVPEVYARYQDGKTAKVVEDGKGGAEVIQFGPDGAEAGRAKFKDLPSFFAAAAGKFDPSKWMERQDKQAETMRVQGNADRDYALRETVAKDQSLLRAAQVEAATARAEASRARAAGGGGGGRAAAPAGPQGLTLADLKDGHKTVATTLNKDYESQLSDTSISAEIRQSIKRTREAEIADVQRLYTGAMTQGIAVTPEQIIAAYRTGTRGIREVPDASGKSYKVEGMQVGDRFIPFATQPGKFVAPSSPAAATPKATKEPPPIFGASQSPPGGPMPAPAAPAATSRGDPVLAKMEQGSRDQIVSMNDAVVQARQMLAAASKSGDPAAVQRYAQQLQQAVTARDAKAAQLLGNGAAAFLQSLPS